jgi:hypothetical protein
VQLTVTRRTGYREWTWTVVDEDGFVVSGIANSRRRAQDIIAWVQAELRYPPMLRPPSNALRNLTFKLPLVVED